MNRLWIQLTLGFALVVLASTLILALLTNARAGTTFRGYLAETQTIESGLLERLGSYYAAQGTWAGAESLLVLPNSLGPGHRYGQGQGQGQGQGAALRSSLVLADAAGHVVADPSGLAAGAELSAGQRAESLPILAQGQPVGYLLVSAPRGAAVPAAAQRFLDDLNRNIWTTGLLVGGVGIVLGLLMARGLVAPLDRLVVGARRIACGHLAERVPVDGPAEVGAVARAFNAMATALEAGEEQRRQMVADIAHELRTPLTVVQGNLRALLDDVYPLSKVEVATIYEATLGLRHLVDDLRILSLAEAGRLELNLRPVAVVPLLEQEVALFGDLAATQGVQLDFEVRLGLPPMLADVARLNQVLHNLVGNALHHTPAGGSVTIAATAGADQRSIVVDVRDTGTGIDPADVPHVFDRFYRADRARARETGGSGLGLAITRQLILLQGGEIGVESIPGQGSRFWFQLPVAPGAPGETSYDHPLSAFQTR